MSEYCAKCGDRIDGFTVHTVLCKVEDDGETYTVDVTEFEDWYCFECYPPEE